LNLDTSGDKGLFIRANALWTCPGLMDTPKSAKVSAEGVNGGEERKAEAA
jgi:hypothetical protein